MHRSGAPYRVRGLHCIWLVPRTRASSDGVDDSNLGEWIYLKRGISSGWSGAQQATEVLSQEFWIKSPRGTYVYVLSFYTRSVCKMTHPSHRWTYREGTLSDEPSRTTSSSSSSYSLREIVPEREPISVIDLSDDESVERPEMAPVAPGIELGTSIKEDLSEPTSD
ncbi:hypothetical protein M9H77_12900 [Catharanthus roseus]|uniref:Uncharacterized protein n=1 Tax=Catharanthus roseus TaxID=4058 RepID=A0ACC0BIW7_CATRO|nr:hypothetical protein M9H77_12900 [Catharanthus roseus]